MKKIICKGPIIDFLEFYVVRGRVAYLQEKSSEEEFDQHFLRDYEEDFQHGENETESVTLDRIKRYKKIVDRLKVKYGSECQICHFTFEKENGGYYAEGHHLEWLSQGGTQEEENVVILCPNHHRMFHYAKGVNIGERVNNKRNIILDGQKLEIYY